MPGRELPSLEPIPHLRKRRALPAVWMRAGTSKGLYLHRRDLPVDPNDWAPVITRVMGSYDADPKQLDGLGGATSTTSKVAVVSRSHRPGVDVDYSFVQVSVGSAKVDMTGNCGNIASGVGPFAIDEGLVHVAPGQTEVSVRVYNTNTNSVMVETVEVDDEGHFLEDGDCALPGLRSMGSTVRIAFSDPAGAMTGKLLPTGHASDTIHVTSAYDSCPVAVSVSMVDAANPFCFVDGASLPEWFHNRGDPGAPECVTFIEDVRRCAAVSMGLAPTIEAAALVRGTPKIAILSHPSAADRRAGVDLQCLAHSMGRVHGSLQLTGAVCLATAACTKGTLAWSIRHAGSKADSKQHVSSLKSDSVAECIRLRHSGGVMNVEVTRTLSPSPRVDEVTVLRTARRLFEGTAYYLS